MDSGYAGQSIGSPRFTVVGLALQAVMLKRLAGVPTHRLWQTMIGLSILKPFGLYEKGEDFEPTSTFSHDAETRDRDIRRPNPHLADYPVHLVAAGADRIRRPFWICNSSMFVNEPGAEGQDLVPVHATPFFTGIVGRPDAVDANGLRVGGGAVATFAFSSRPLGVEKGSVRARQRRPFSLSDAVGLSSVAFASGLEQKLDEWRRDHTALVDAMMNHSDNLTGWAEDHFEGEVPKALEKLLHRPTLVKFLEKSGLGAKLDAELVKAINEINDFIPEQHYWPVRSAELQRSARSEEEARPTRFADGGNLENTGIANLLTYLDVERIIAFVNSPTSMKSVDVGIIAAGSVEEVPDTRILVDNQVSVLFGYRGHRDGKGYVLYADSELDTLPAEEKPFRAVQVFAPEAFPETLRGLWAASHGLRRPAVFAQDLVTVENSVFGVRAGRRVQVLWCYLDRVDDWLDLLTDDVRGLLTEKGYESFPSFPTNQGLNPTQINLMAHLTSWCVADPSNREPFLAMYR